MASSSKLFLLPIVGTVFAVSAFATAYLVAVFKKDVYPWWPYISDTGTTVPESCIFGELLTLTAITGMAVVFIRYKWIQCISELGSRLHTLNAIALAVGLISCVGMTFVANFQETSVRPVHMPSSAITFGFAVIYNIMHTVITKKTTPVYSRVCIWCLRLTLSVVGVVAFGLMYGFGVTATAKSSSFFGNDSHKRLEWNPEDPAWSVHVVSTVSEWVIGLSVALYFLTYTPDFANIRMSVKSELLSPRRSDGLETDVAPIWEIDERMSREE